MEKIQTEEVDVLEVVWLKKVEIIVFSLIVSVSAYITSSFFTKQYSTESTILLTPPKYSLKEKRSFLSLEGYTRMARSSGMLEAVIDQLGPKYPHYQGLMHPEILEGFVSISYSDTTLPKLKGRASLATIEIRGSDKVFIKDFANILVSLVIEKGQQLRKDEIKTIGKITKEQFALGLKSLKEAENTLNKTLVKNHLEFAEADLMTKRTNLKHYEYTLLEINLKLIRLRGDPGLLVDKSPTSRIKKDHVTAQQKDLSELIKTIRNEILELEKNVYRMKLQEKQLKRNVEGLSNNHKALTNRLEKIAISEAETTSDIRLLSKATEPYIPIWPNKLKITFLAGALSFALSIIVACSKKHIDNLSRN